MAAVTIRNVPREVVDKLAERAANRGMSMEAYLRDLLARDARTDTPREFTERVRKDVEGSGVRLSIEDILAARDADRP